MAANFKNIDLEKILDTTGSLTVFGQTITKEVIRPNLTVYLCAGQAKLSLDEAIKVAADFESQIKIHIIKNGVGSVAKKVGFGTIKALAIGAAVTGAVLGSAGDMLYKAGKATKEAVSKK